ncbi:MAG: amidohydrolase family protein, partial [Bryobacteraceae bacterium]
DIISIRLDEPNAVPLYNVYSQIVYSLKASDVGDVMVNGRILVRNRRMLTIDNKAVMAKAEEYRAQVAKSLAGN